jgi:FMN phosphatase YigB (HAD superfamily)
MVGDRVNLDVAGARSAGVHAVWLNRDGARKNDSDTPVDYEIRGLGELAALLDAL